jgi:prepilin-type N-terminal cleavage/methylation domain-containing protein
VRYGGINVNFAATQMMCYTESMTTREQAFSMIEILVVLGIISLVLGLSTTYFFSFKSSSAVNIAAQEIVATLNQARSLAITRRNDYKVFFNVSANTYVVKDSSDSDIDMLHHLGNGISFTKTTFGSDTVVFKPTGSLRNLNGSIYIKNSGGKFNTIRIANTTGRIKVYTYEETSE